MKKLLYIVLLATMVVGCSSSNKDEGIKGIDISNIVMSLVNNKTNEKEGKDDEVVGEEKPTSNNTDTNADEKKTDDDKTSSPSGGDSNSGGSNTGTQEKPATPTPPKEDIPAKPPQKPTPPPVVDTTPAPPSNQQAKADQVFAQINAYRQQNGIAPFAYSSLLKSQSDAHALAMASREALWHSGGAAECVTNYDDPFTAWKNSPAHNDILLCNNTEGAVGIYYYNGYYYSVFQCQW